MHPFWVIFFASCAGLFLFMAWKAGNARPLDNEVKELKRIARALGGSIFTVASFPRPFVVFKIDGTESTFHYLADPSDQIVTTLECRIGFSGFLQAASHDSLRRPAQSPRFRRLEDAEGFELVTTHPLWSVEMLDAGLRDILRTLKRENRRTRLTLGADRFAIEIEDWIVPYEVRALTGVMRRLALLSRTLAFCPGVTILGEVAIAGGGRCPICSQTCETAGMACPVCRAPHHADCWAYLGRCAIFGCRGGIVTSVSRG